MDKKVIVSNETPNDQGSIVLNAAIDLTRFKQNPIMLYDHQWDKPIGHWENVQFDGRNWTGVPVFSAVESAAEYGQLWEEGNLKAASIGGAVRYRMDKMDNVVRDANGNRIVEKFVIYEISIVPIPSNPDAVTTLSAKVYNDAEIVEFNSKLMAKKNVETEKPAVEETVEQAANAETIAPVETTKPEETKAPPAQKTHVILKAFNELAEAFKSLVSSHDEPDGDEAVKTTDLPSGEMPQGGVQAKATIEAEALEKVNNCNNASELDELENTADLPQVVKVAIEQRRAALKAKETEVKQTQNKTFIKMETEKPELIEKTDLAAKIAPEPVKKNIIVMGGGQTLTELRGTADGRKMLDKLAAGGSNDIAERVAFLSALIADRKYAAVTEKMRFVTNASEAMLKDYAKNVAPTGDTNLESLLRKNIASMQLGSSADALTTPETTAVEWLALVLFKLFPSAGWKSEIPIFGATETGNNLGVIWTNIAADPTVAKGAKPAPADYEYSDTAVSLKMINFWLQPMLWTPLTMHLLRYDQMATGWEQALMKLRTSIDNELIYTLANLIPAASRIFTDGSAFNIAAAADIDSFLLNPNFVGALAKPQLSNLLKIAQLFNKQNFAEGTKFVVVQDPTMDRYITDDPSTKSLLTRFVNSQGDELVGYKNAMLRTRSQVALYDPATVAVIDPSGVVPATSVSAGLGFVPDQVGIGLGKFDVFMIQDPTKYGYKMSCDIRMGIQPLRADFKGTALYTYGQPII